MDGYKLSEIEETLYNYIKDNDGSTAENIKKTLGNKAVGAIGKLLRYDRIVKEKRRTGDSAYGLRKVETYYVVKKEKTEDTGE